MDKQKKMYMVLPYLLYDLFVLWMFYPFLFQIFMDKNYFNTPILFLTFAIFICSLICFFINIISITKKNIFVYEELGCLIKVLQFFSVLLWILSFIFGFMFIDQ